MTPTTSPGPRKVTSILARLAVGSLAIPLLQAAEVSPGTCQPGVVRDRQVAAFPGAEGFGASASGGRGGSVLHVTSLAARGPGSLQAALDSPGARTVVFDVAGVIEGVPIMTHGDVTLAGQTSPGGITLRGLLIQGDEVNEEPTGRLPSAAPSNFIVRHLRLRPGRFDSPDGAGDGLRLHHAARGVIDHVSVGNAMDEAVQISFSHDITLSYCLLAETLGEHAEFGGMLLNYSDPRRGWPLTRLSIHHTMWNRIVGRNPEISRENVPDNGFMDLEVSNNVLWDTQRPAYLASHNPQDGSPLHYHLNMVSNYSVQNPRRAQSYGLLAVEGGPDPERPSFTPRSSVYLAGNSINLRHDLSDWQLVYNCNDLLAAAEGGELPYSNHLRPQQARDVRHEFPPISLVPDPEELVTLLATQAGALPRDPMDRRLMGAPQQRRFADADPSVNPAGDTTALDFTPRSAPQPSHDSDGDGMPDAFERSQGLNPHDPMDRNLTSLSRRLLGVEGYTNLEVYLEIRHRQLLKAAWNSRDK